MDVPPIGIYNKSEKYRLKFVDEHPTADGFKQFQDGVLGIVKTVERDISEEFLHCTELVLIIDVREFGVL